MDGFITERFNLTITGTSPAILRLFKGGAVRDIVGGMLYAGTHLDDVGTQTDAHHHFEFPEFDLLLELTKADDPPGDTRGQPSRPLPPGPGVPRFR